MDATDIKRCEAIAALNDDELTDFVTVTRAIGDVDVYTGGKNGGRGTVYCLLVTMVALASASDTDVRTVTQWP